MGEQTLSPTCICCDATPRDRLRKPYVGQWLVDDKGGLILHTSDGLYQVTAIKMEKGMKRRPTPKPVIDAIDRMERLASQFGDRHGPKLGHD